MTGEWLVLVESNTTGSGRLFCAAARRLGLQPVLLARDPGRYGYVAADRIDARVVDTSSPDAVRAACADLPGRIAGVTSSSEYYIGTAAEVAGALGRPHPDPDAIRSCRNKHSQRIRLQQAGVPGPAFAAAPRVPEAVVAAIRIGLPVVVKPVAGSGSIGTRSCRTLEEVRAAASAVLDTDPADLALPPQPEVMVEAQLDGAEYSVETLDDQVVAVIRKRLGPEPYFLETGHDFPAPLDPAERAAIGEIAVAALRALGLGWGAAHVEVRAGAVGPRIVEVNPRLAGGMIPRMIQEALGVDLIFQVVAKAAGRAEPPQPTRSRAASIRFLVAPASGRLVEVAGMSAAQRLPGVVEVGLTCQPGQDVVIRHSFQDRLGYVIASAADGNVAAQAAEDGVRALEARIAPASVIAEGFLR
ncbi:MAG: ATP-grasp domain-containing protein [Sporichthyaceae bacterium]|nr:ATP-grasp domain-containing protein [Sporichthyaceae bacterium]